MIDHTAPIAEPGRSRGPDIEAFGSDVFRRVLEAMDPSLQRYTDKLGPLVERGHAALLDWLSDGEFSDEAAEQLGEVAWLAINQVPLDVIDELEVAFIVTATDHFGREARVIEGAKRVALCWYDGFWPFEHPAAVAQAVRFGMLANKLPAPVFMAGDDQRITFSSYELDALLGLHQGEVERFTMSELFATELNVGAGEPTFVVTEVGGKIRHLTVTVLPTTTEVGTEYFGFVEDRTREVALEQMRDGVVAAISHELRTPLTAIIGYLELITSEDLPPEDHESSLAIVKSESELLLAPGVGHRGLLEVDRRCSRPQARSIPGRTGNRGRHQTGVHRYGSDPCGRCGAGHHDPFRSGPFRAALDEPADQREEVRRTEHRDLGSSRRGRDRPVRQR